MSPADVTQFVFKLNYGQVVCFAVGIIISDLFTGLFAAKRTKRHITSAIMADGQDKKFKAFGRFMIISLFMYIASFLGPGSRTMELGAMTMALFSVSSDITSIAENLIIAWRKIDTKPKEGETK